MGRRIRVVLVRPRRGGNVGSVARAMKNMGLSELVLVAPRTPVAASARNMAAHARDVLAARRTVPDLDAALADVTLAVGTVGREIALRRPVVTVREIAPAILDEAHRGRVALVFGPEDHGLSNADLDRCQQLVTIPTAEAYASLNLAQAVLVCAYELRLASGTSEVATALAGSRRRAERDAESALASGREREALFGHLEESLTAVGFLSQQNPVPIMRDVRSLFARAGLTRRDVRLWRGVARQMGWAARQIKGRGRGSSRS